MSPVRPPPQPVGALPRLLALAIDGLWLLGVSLPWGWDRILAAPGASAGPFWLALGGLSLLLLPCWLLLGGSPGQLLLDQRVVDDHGAPRLLLRQALLRWLAGWLTLASLGYGPLWRDGSGKARAWHDRLSGTVVVERDPERREGALYRHWVGELPLAQSLWVNTLALPLPLLLLLGAVQAAAPLHGGLLRAAGLLLPLGAVLLLALLAWAVVGSWRAAARAPQQRRVSTAPAWQRLGVRGLLLVYTGALLGLLGSNLLPGLADGLWLLFGRDPLGVAAATVSADGRRLHVKGALGLGSAAQVQAALQGAPRLRWVVLESRAGRLPEAQAVAAAIHARGLPTRVQGECSGSCPFAFLGGARRQLLPGARLGLQRLSAGVYNPLFQNLLNRSYGQQLAAAGLAPHLVRKTLATPPTAVWFLAADELAASGLVSVPERPLDVELPEPAGAVLADYAEALSASALWQALEQRFPGLQGIAAEHMAAAGTQGPVAVQEAGQQVVAAVMPPLLAQASPETRWLFAEILLAQMTALAEDPEQCRALLLGLPAAQRQLPPELAWKEAQWLLGALAEAPRAAPPRGPRPLELEVIRRTLGLRAPAHLAALWRPAQAPAPGEPDCARGRAMLSELSTLAAPQRRLALRLMFERGPGP